MLGVAAVGATAVPLVSGWQNAYTTQIPAVLYPTDEQQVRDQPTQIVVDLQDNASLADIAAIETRIGAKLTFNSPQSEDDKMLVATLPTATAAYAAMERLEGDSRVEVAEPQETYRIPEMSDANSVEMQAVAIAEASRRATLAGKTEARQAARQAGLAVKDYVAASSFDDHVLPLGYSAPVTEAEISGSAIWRGMESRKPYTVRLDNRTYNVDAAGQWVFAPVAASTLPVSASANAYVCGESLLPVSDVSPLRPGGTKPNDPLYDKQWNFQMVGAEDAWRKTRGKGVTVAVIDTGVAAITTKKGKQCRDFGTTSFVPGYDFVNKDADAYDDHGHGTHVAGTIAESTNNNEGVAGLAYEANIMPLKVLGANGSGNSSDIADAIRFAADNGAAVINMSLGSNQPSSVIQKACQYAVKKGVTIVCAAGNSFKEGVGYPAAFPECVAVSSVGPTGQLATYSSWGKQVALAAPGGDMMESGDAKDGILQNTVMTGGERGKGDDYYAFQGTSMASPHVAAVAALIASQGVTDPARVRDILTKSATPNGDAKKYGAGILSAAGAVSLTGAVEGIKLRHFLLLGGTLLLLCVGSRRSFGTRLGMAGALGAGFFGADYAATVFGANSAWNLLTFSAAVPAVAYLTTRKSLGGVKIAGSLALGTAVALWAGWHNDLSPFTAYTFGAGAATPWTLANMGAAFVIANLAGWKAIRLSGGTGSASTK